VAETGREDLHVEDTVAKKLGPPWILSIYTVVTFLFVYLCLSVWLFVYSFILFLLLLPCFWWNNDIYYSYRHCTYLSFLCLSLAPMLRYQRWSLKLVSPGAVTDGVTLFLPQNSDDLFLVIVSTPTLSTFPD